MQLKQSETVEIKMLNCLACLVQGDYFSRGKTDDREYLNHTTAILCCYDPVCQVSFLKWMSRHAQGSVTPQLFHFHYESG